MVPCAVAAHTLRPALQQIPAMRCSCCCCVHVCVCHVQVEIGAFRTYPEGYKPPDEGPSEYQTIPLSKIEDFGVHAKQVSAKDTIQCLPDTGQQARVVYCICSTGTHISQACRTQV